MRERYGIPQEACVFLFGVTWEAAVCRDFV